jgi:hypothetical protein
MVLVELFSTMALSNAETDVASARRHGTMIFMVSMCIGRDLLEG